MSIKFIRRLEYANYLIKHKATGDLTTFSKKMMLSKSAVRDLIGLMREMGAKINYDRFNKSYYYQENGEFCAPKFMLYGEVLHNQQLSALGKPEELCFSESQTFILCN